MERVCRRFRSAALSLPCRLELNVNWLPETGSDSVLRCLRGRTPGDLDLVVFREGECMPHGQLVAQLVPTATR